jgi:hypothetical protein
MTNLSEYEKFLQKHFTKKEIESAFYRPPEDNEMNHSEKKSPSTLKVELIDNSGEILIRNNPDLGKMNVKHRLAKKEVFQELMALNLFYCVRFENIDFTDKRANYDFSEGYTSTVDLQNLSGLALVFKNCKIGKVPAEIFELELDYLAFDGCEIDEFPIDACKQGKSKDLSFISTSIKNFAEVDQKGDEESFINTYRKHLIFRFVKIPFEKSYILKFFENVIYENLYRLDIGATSTYSLNAVETKMIFQAIPNVYHVLICGEYENVQDIIDKKPVGLTDIDFSLIDIELPRLTRIKLTSELTTLPLGIEKLIHLSSIIFLDNKFTFSSFDFDRISLLPKLNTPLKKYSSEMRFTKNLETTKIMKKLNQMLPDVLIPR